MNKETEYELEVIGKNQEKKIYEMIENSELTNGEILDRRKREYIINELKLEPTEIYNYGLQVAKSNQDITEEELITILLRFIEQKSKSKILVKSAKRLLAKRGK